MPQRVSENVVICIDTSRSMFRTDFKPNRLYSCINAIKKLIQKRFEEDGKSTFAIVSFSDNANKVSDFTSVESQLSDMLDSLTIGGRSNMGDGIALSIKILIGELRKVMANIPRILLISDGINTETINDPIKMARLAQGLNIKIDTFRLGVMSQLNILKKLSDLTKGKYYYSNDSKSLLAIAQKFADSNIKIPGSDMESLIKNPSFLRKIAAKLLRVQDLTKTQELRLKQIRGEADFKKCTICFQEDDPTTKGSFYLTGRYCPNCQTPYHIHCLAGWAMSQTDETSAESGTCRCPHCFYLLNIPLEVTQAQKLRSLSGLKYQKQENSQKSEILPATLENISDLGDDAIYSSCPICHYIFEENQQVVKCGDTECRTLYHIECFQKLENGQCKSCGNKLHLY
ncbi:MAG: VWA domain-containing protein [Candidatus Hodarchaeota archaeon]